MFVEEIVGCLMVSFNKLSVLSLYLFLTPSTNFRTWVYGLMTFVAVFTVVFIYLQTLQCDPAQAQWNYSIGHCKTSSVQTFSCCGCLSVLSQDLLDCIHSGSATGD